MKYYRELTLKSGAACILRNPTADDAAEILHHMRQTSAETENMLRYADEIALTEQQERLCLAEIAQRQDAIMICAIVGGKLVSNAGFNPVSTAERCRHRAEFGISVKRDYWGLGIGFATLTASIETARQAGYEQLELDVVASNHRAISLYRSCGFEQYGLHKNAFRYRDGHYEDLCLMLLRL